MIQSSHLTNEIINKFEFYNKHKQEIVVKRFIVQSIEIGAFLNGYENVIRLDLSNNFIQSIEPNQFKGLVNLKRLCMANNHIRALRKSYFTGLGKLSFLDLSQNSIDDIEPCSFADLNDLSVILLNNNQISSDSFLKHCDQLKQLKYLNISQNKLKNIDSVKQTYLTHVSFDDQSFSIILVKLCIHVVEEGFKVRP